MQLRGLSRNLTLQREIWSDRLTMVEDLLQQINGFEETQNNNSASLDLKTVCRNFIPEELFSLKNLKIYKYALHDGNNLGASPSQILTLQKVITDPTIECPICLANAQNMVITNCKHAFHFNCIARWLIDKRLCPVCRGETFPQPADPWN